MGKYGEFEPDFGQRLLKNARDTEGSFLQISNSPYGFFETHRHIEHIDFMIKKRQKLCVLCVYVFQKMPYKAF